MEAYIVKIAPAAEGEELALTIEITDEKDCAAKITA